MTIKDNMFLANSTGAWFLFDSATSRKGSRSLHVGENVLVLYVSIGKFWCFILTSTGQHAWIQRHCLYAIEENSHEHPDMV